MTGAICDGGPAHLERRIHLCPTEGRRRRFVVRMQLWYGAEWYCLGCGDAWADGELRPRPWARGWRAKAVARARELWAAVAYPAGGARQARKAWLDRELAEAQA